MPILNQTAASHSTEKGSSDFMFNQVSRSHILHCSYDYWHPKYRSSALKSKIIPLPPTFIKYLCSDGIILSDDSFTNSSYIYNNYDESSLFSESDSENDMENCPSVTFPELHQQIKDCIAELGGLVAPKLNWSAPKDATWISMMKNSMECATPDDIYLLLKSSDFITFDLEHAFDGTVEDNIIGYEDINYVLVLRKWFHINHSSEFRCFVRERNMIAISQRDLNYFEFLFSLKDKIRDTILSFFNKILKDSFPDPNFVFDVYLPTPLDCVRLIDINAWAPRTDPLLFSWHELLSLKDTKYSQRISMADATQQVSKALDDDHPQPLSDLHSFNEMPEIRLVQKNDLKAFNFTSPQYSASKMPREVVQAGMMGQSGMKDFTDQWKKMLSGEFEMQSGLSSDEEN